MKLNLLFIYSLFCGLSLASFNMPYRTYQQQCKTHVFNTRDWIACYKKIFGYGNFLLNTDQLMNAWRHFNVDCSPYFSGKIALRSSRIPGLPGFLCKDKYDANIMIASGSVYRPNTTGYVINGIDFMGPIDNNNLNTN